MNPPNVPADNRTRSRPPIWAKSVLAATLFCIAGATPHQLDTARSTFPSLLKSPTTTELHQHCLNKREHSRAKENSAAGCRKPWSFGILAAGSASRFGNLLRAGVFTFVLVSSHAFVG